MSTPFTRKPASRDRALAALCEALGAPGIAADVELATRDRDAWFAHHAKELAKARPWIKSARALPEDLRSLAFFDAALAKKLLVALDWKAGAEEIAGAAATLARRHPRVRAGARFAIALADAPPGDTTESLDEVAAALAKVSAALVEWESGGDELMVGVAPIAEAKNLVRLATRARFEARVRMGRAPNVHAKARVPIPAKASATKPLVVALPEGRASEECFFAGPFVALTRGGKTYIVDAREPTKEPRSRKGHLLGFARSRGGTWLLALSTHEAWESKGRITLGVHESPFAPPVRSLAVEQSVRTRLATYDFLDERVAAVTFASQGDARGQLWLERDGALVPVKVSHRDEGDHLSVGGFVRLSDVDVVYARGHGFVRQGNRLVRAFDAPARAAQVLVTPYKAGFLWLLQRGGTPMFASRNAKARPHKLARCSRLSAWSPGPDGSLLVRPWETMDRVNAAQLLFFDTKKRVNVPRALFGRSQPYVLHWSEEAAALVGINDKGELVVVNKSILDELPRARL